MSENKKGKTLQEIFEKFRKDEDTILFQFMKYGQSWGATDKTPARVSIEIPNDICNNKNRNLGEVEKYTGIVMFILKEKVKEFMKENNEMENTNHYNIENKKTRQIKKLKEYIDGIGAKICFLIDEIDEEKYEKHPPITVEEIMTKTEDFITKLQQEISELKKNKYHF